MRKIALWTTALFVTATAAGCGTASASTAPRWHAAGSAPPATSASPSAVTSAPAAAIVRVKPVKHALGAGPAGSLMQTGTSSVALTFDDGPDPVHTPAMLDLLARNDVKATFCLVGVHVREHPDLVRRIAQDGHTLCNHSWDHSLTLGTAQPATIRADLARTNAAIRDAVPAARIPYFRAPGGNFTAPLVAVAADLEMRSIYWDLDPRDWDHTTDASDEVHRDRLVRDVQHGVRKGSIVLSHDYGQPQTVTAYRTLLPWLEHRYTLVALP